MQTHLWRPLADGGLARLGIVALAFVGFLDALYMLAYHQRMIDSLFCPFFRSGCDVVGRSAHARHFGVPNAAVGALGYAIMAILAVWSCGKPPERQRLPSLGLSVVALGAFVASVYLTWEQWAKIGAWCFWCLLSAGLNLLILPLALWNGSKQEVIRNA